MASGENILWLVESINASGAVSRRVFRTRSAARAWRQRQLDAGRSVTEIWRATWGPEQ
jgi:hypothetical protein